jgi:aryl-phospho-beta-D-glucosidase BglC (GH1 family)
MVRITGNICFDRFSFFMLLIDACPVFVCHSGQSGAIRWQEPQNVNLTLDVLDRMTGFYKKYDNLWGIEVLNEPHWSIPDPILLDFYHRAYTIVRRHSPTLHFVFNSLYGPHDRWANALPEPQYYNVVLDLHLYTVWSGFTNFDQHLAEARRMGEEIRYLSLFYPVVVGEWSVATGLASYTESQKQQFAAAEVNSFVNNAFGWHYWSYKLEYSGDWNWLTIYDLVKAGYV